MFPHTIPNTFSLDSLVPKAAFTPAQHVARQQVARTSNLLRATSNTLLVARNMLCWCKRGLITVTRLQLINSGQDLQLSIHSARTGRYTTSQRVKSHEVHKKLHTRSPCFTTCTQVNTADSDPWPCTVQFTAASAIPQFAGQGANNSFF